MFIPDLSPLLKIVDLVDRYRSIDDPADSELGLRARLDIVLEGAVLLSQYTETEIDDQMVGLIGRALIDDNVIGLLVKLVRWQLQPGVQDVAAQAAVKLDVEAMGIPWLQLVSLAQMLAQLIAALR